MIPFPSVVGPATNEGEPLPDGQGVKCVLLAWDDEPTRLAFADKLRAAGFEVLACDGEFVLERIEQSRPDAILLQLGKGTTQARSKALKTMREQPEFARLPVYVCTTGPTLPTWERARGSNTGPTKLFNTLASPVDLIIRQVIADLQRQPINRVETLNRNNPMEFGERIFDLTGENSDNGAAVCPPALTFAANDRPSQDEPQDTAVHDIGLEADTAPERPRFAIFVLREGGKIHFAYPSALTMFQYTREELLNRGLDELVQGGMTNEIEEFLQRPINRRTASERLLVRVTALAKGGHGFGAALALMPVAEESEARWTAIFKEEPIDSAPSASSELDEQLQAVSAQIADYPEILKRYENAHAALAEEQARTRNLEEEIGGLRRLADDLLGNLPSHSAGSSPVTEALENRLRESAAELERTKTELAKQSIDRINWEAEAQKATERNRSLQDELARLRQSSTSAKPEKREPERRGRDGVKDLARTTADLERERGERRRAEQRASSLAEQLQNLHKQIGQQLESERSAQDYLSTLDAKVREQQEGLARLQAELDKQTAQRQMLEQQVKSSEHLSVHLRNCVSSFEVAKNAFKRTQEELDSRLQSAQAALQESEASRQKEISERHRLEVALSAAQRTVQEQAHSALELTKLRCALEVEQAERKRLEGDAVQSQFASLDSARVGLNMLHDFRTQLLPAADALLQSTRHLLKLQLKEEEKQIAETLLENALLLQSNLQEPMPLDTPGKSEH